MKLGRRAFLQFAAGAVGGTLLTPIPWKLMDDSAIWSQNWSWRPSPERGAITKVATTCMFCDGGCGIQARLVEKNRAILLEGNPKNPVNAGGICPLGAAGLQFLYASYRVAQPMKQTKKRGDAGGLQFIDWTEAIAILSSKLAQLKSEGSAKTVACVTGQRRSSMDALWQQFFTAYGSPNFFRMPAQADSLELAAMLTLGQRAPFAFALENASYVLSFGADLLEGWGAPGRMQAAYRLWRQENGDKPATKVVQVDSRCSMTASKADQWIAIAPGMEAALALGIAHVLVKENLYDADFVKNYVFGFDDWTDSQGKSRKGFKNLILTAEYTPDEVAKRTGLEASRIRELAKEFAGSSNAVVVWGEASGNLPGNIYNELSFVALNALKGNLKSGGTVSLVPSVPLEPLPDLQIDAAAKRTLDEQRLDRQQTQRFPLPGNDFYAFLDAASKGAPYPINVLMVHEANPAHSLPEYKVFQAAVEKVGFLVSFSSYLDETAQQADLILPNHMALQRYDDAIGLPGVPYAYYALASPILKPGPGTKHSGDVVLALSKGLGGSVTTALPWNDYQSYLQKRVEGLAASQKGAVADKPDMELWKLQPGDLVPANYKDGADLWKKLTSGLCWYDAPVGAMQEVETASGKFELALSLLETKGLAGATDSVYLPHFVQLSPSGDENEYPLLLISYPTMNIANGYLPNPPFMTKTVWDFVLKGKDLFVELNPQTAQSLGMAEGSHALLKTPRGELPVRVHLYPGARAGVVYMVEGLGHAAYDQYIQDKGVNANSIIEVQLDPVTGLGTVWATRAQLRRA
jgi:menaquinone reductase, molybdopterin-binding-like subunit